MPAKPTNASGAVCLESTRVSPSPVDLKVQPSPALLDFWATCQRVGRPADRSSRLYFWRGAREGFFPVPVKVSAARVAWRSQDIDRWLSGLTKAVYAPKSGVAQ
jgi:predicted DNA-binding transcriptional regulator AlpA